MGFNARFQILIERRWIEEHEKHWWTREWQSRSKQEGTVDV